MNSKFTRFPNEFYCPFVLCFAGMNLPCWTAYQSLSKPVLALPLFIKYLPDFVYVLYGEQAKPIYLVESNETILFFLH